MRLNSLVYTAAIAGYALAKNVVCKVDDVAVATVDLDTGVCPFKLPTDLPVKFDFTSAEDYDITFYYSLVSDKKYFTDIVNEGLTIDIPANLLYGKTGAPFFQIHGDKTPSSNSTAALRRRLLGKTVYARDEQDTVIAELKALDGTEITGSSFTVVDPTDADVSSSVTGAPAATDGVSTVTDEVTTVVTITSCSENKCHLTAVPAKEVVTTVTVDDEVTSYTTYCPLSEEAVASTTYVTTVTVNGEVTSYTTVCPVTEAADVTTIATTNSNGESYESTSTHFVTEYITLTSSSQSMVETVTTVTINGEVTAYTTFCPVEAAETGAPTSPAAASPVAASLVASYPVTNSTTASNSTSPTTLAPVAVTSAVVGVGSARDSYVTLTVQQTETLSGSSGVPTTEEAVSTYEAAAAAISGFSSLIIMALASVAWLL